ncbi:CEREBLON [Salix purpurea]|uniref:CEREBLON n=1 Tax=Salix purpurea TaxID=77065 RepID=A0A9Q0WH80_SALPP|nr:CEREBLON [Salix purpurea]
MAASISSAGGIRGGGLYTPILTIVVGFDLKTASSSSVFMVTGGTIANVMRNLCTRSDKFGGKILVDYDISLLSEPCVLLGVSVGVILESEEVKRNGCGNLENGLVKNEASSKGSGEVEGVKEPLLGVKLTRGSIFPVEEVYTSS